MLTVADIERFLLPIRRRLQIAVGRAVLLAVNNTGKTQRHKVKFSGDEVVEGMSKLQEYGLETYPPKDDTSEEVVLSPAGARDLAFIVMTSIRALRPTFLQEGEVLLYSKSGNGVYLKQDGSILISNSSGSGKILIAADNTITIYAGAAAVNVQGGAITLKGTSVDLKDSGGEPVMLETVINKFNSHTHSGVAAGGGVTGAPVVPWVAGVDSAANVKAKA